MSIEAGIALRGQYKEIKGISTKTVRKSSISFQL